jgi:glyceraldehyde 3-phosphate dehydrogenase
MMLQTYTPDMRIISNASCTTNCLAPLIAIIHESLGIEEALMTTIHAMTASQSTVDGPMHGGKDFRSGRCASENIIPASTGAASAIKRVLPELGDKISGLAFRVPTATVSCVDLTCRLITPISSMRDIDDIIKAASAQTRYNNVVSYTDKPVVSTDMKGSKYSCIYDSTASIMLNGNFVKLIAWYYIFFFSIVISNFHLCIQTGMTMSGPMLCACSISFFSFTLNNVCDIRYI